MTENVLHLHINTHRDKDYYLEYFNAYPVCRNIIRTVLLHQHNHRTRTQVHANNLLNKTFTIKCEFQKSNLEFNFALI